jgi:hypothetical protein
MTNPPPLNEAYGRIGSSFRLTTNLLPVTLLVQPWPNLFHTAFHGLDVGEVANDHSTIDFKVVYDGRQWVALGYASDLWFVSVSIAGFMNICLLIGSLEDVRHGSTNLECKAKSNHCG